MLASEQPLIVIGHKNPDTDSICSSLAYAHFKQQCAGIRAIPYRAGNINPQTSFVLSRFGVKAPELLTNLYPKLEDIMIQGKEVIVLKPEETLGRAQEVILSRRFAFLPVADEDGKYLGKVTTLRLAGLLTEMPDLCRRQDVLIDLERLFESIGGRVLTDFSTPVRFRGNLFIQGVTELLVGKGRDLLALVGGGGEGFDEVIGAGAKVVVVCGRDRVGSEVVKSAQDKGVCLVESGKDLLGTVAQLCLSMPVREFTERTQPAFKPYDLVRQVRQQIANYNDGGFIVVDDDQHIQGVVTRISFLAQSRFRVVLVDHNEFSQAVDGIEEADVVEIIDHHRLGNRSTANPSRWMNRVVGSTATIVADLYKQRGFAPPPAIAGLLLSAILSDTVILRSPTTTPLDQEMASWLAKKAGVEVKAYGQEMFSAGCALEGMTPKQLVQQDLKVYHEKNWKFSLSQIEMVGFDQFHELRPALREQLTAALEGAKCQFSCLMVTDVTQGTSLLLAVGERRILDAISHPRLEEDLFEMKSVLSRKKQVVPYFLDLLRKL